MSWKLWLLGTALLGLAWTQTVSSSLEGTVVDSTRAAVPSAEVVLTNVATGTSLRTTTDGSGGYAFPSIPAGTYSLKVSKDGFGGYELTGFKIAAAQHTNQDVVLNVGQVSQTVTVNGGGLANVLETASNDLGTLVEHQSVSELPLNGRNLLQLGLISGATGSTGQGVSAQYQGAGRSLLTINVAGNENDFTMYLIDGIQTTGSRAGNISLGLSLGAIDQFQVHYGFFLPDLGPDPGVVDLITKSGTNHFHGEAYDYLRNNQMDARTFFSNIAPGPYRRNQFGGDVGGPILRDKIFFFGSYESLRQVQSAFAGAFAPTQQMFGGDFSSVTTPIYNPLSFDPATGKRAPFAGNVIPANLINPVSKKLLQYYIPGSNYATRPFNVSGTPRTTLGYDQFLIRGDADVSERNRLFADVSYYNSPATNAGLFPLSGTSFPMDAQMAALGWTSTLSTTKVNELRLGFVRNSVYSLGQYSEGVQNQIGITGTADPNGVPAIALNGIGSFGQQGGRLGNIDNSYQLHDSFSWLRGRHMIKMGGDLNYVRSIQDSANAYARGNINFQTTYSSQLTTNAQGALVSQANTGNSFADFLLGMPTTAMTDSMPHTHYRWTIFEPYIQDVWRIRPGLTLNMGLAYFLSTPPNPSGQDRMFPHSFDFTTGHVLYAALGQISPEVFSLTTRNVAPRLGLVWSPGFLKDTVIRAGGGIYYAQPDFFDSQYSIVAPGITVSKTINNTQPTPTYVFGTNVIPPVQVGNITQQFANSAAGSLNYVPPVNPTPYVEQWNIDIQHSFGPQYLLDLAYMGNEGHHLRAFWNTNDCFNPATRRCSTPIPYPQFPFIAEVANQGNSNTHALLVKFRRQFSGGLSVLANYTYSKTITASSQGGYGLTNQNGNCLSCDRGLALFSVPQSLVVSTVWDLPLGRGGRWLKNRGKLANTVVAGWGLDFIATFHGGMPFTVTAPNSTSWPQRSVRANRFCNGRSELKNQDLRTNGMVWLDTSCFAAPPAGSLGNSGQAILNGPGENNWDIGAHKDFRIREGTKIQFRGEFFDTFNHAQFTNPDSGVASVNYGKVIAVGVTPRQIQLSLRLLF